jgi:ABC-type uncharacterized transport system YnjBCD permease subunit
MQFLPLIFDNTPSIGTAVTTLDLIALVRYFADVIAGIGTENDWLAALPSHWQPVATEIGQQLAQLFGG